ncbi:MAG TPA: hypothetical protein VM531_11370 [Sphingomicrobium sp.]|nr:hypothetical protein [Sphingomicrobium sp.]
MERLLAEQKALIVKAMQTGEQALNGHLVEKLAEAERRLREIRLACEKAGYSPWNLVTAGANPQKDGSMSPPLWHGECKWCHVKAPTKPQWNYPSHPQNDCVWLALLDAGAGQGEKT